MPKISRTVALLSAAVLIALTSCQASPRVASRGQPVGNEPGSTQPIQSSDPGSCARQADGAIRCSESAHEVASTRAEGMPSRSSAPLGVVPAGVSDSRPEDLCIDDIDGAFPISLEIGGETASGFYVLPSGPPRAIVSVSHGYGHTAVSWIEHMKRMARDHQAIAVSMHYRGLDILVDDDGDGLPGSRAWPVLKGAEDQIAATKVFESRCPTATRIVNLGISMGGNTSGLVAAAGAKRSSGATLFDYWFDIEGAVNLIETYFTARGAAPADAYAARALVDIERETGGPIEQRRSEFERRTVVLRIGDIKAGGVKGVILVHGLDDGLVPYNQSRELAGLLARESIPYDFFTVGRRSAESERETTATGHAAGRANSSYMSPLVGHASEKSTTHIIMVTAFKRLGTLLAGKAPGTANEYFVDGPTGTYPAP